MDHKQIEPGMGRRGQLAPHDRATTSCQTISPKTSISFLLIFLAVELGINCTTPQDAVASENITTVREVFIESDRSPDPYALTKTEDGGYIIAGTLGGSVPWAIRIGADRGVLWRHELPLKRPTSTARFSQYRGAAQMADNGTLLCGFIQQSDNPPRILGLVTRVDRSGRIEWQRSFHPQGSQNIHLSYLQKCIRWSDGYALLGEAVFSHPELHRSEYFYWVLALDAQGDVKWEKLIPTTLTNIDEFNQPLVMPSKDLIFSARRSGDEIATEVIRISPNGEIGAQRKLQGLFIPAIPEVSDSALQMVSIGHGRATLRMLGPQFDDVGELVSSYETIPAKRAFRLPDHSIVLFGYQLEHLTATATVVRLGAALDTKRTLFLEPRWTSRWVSDALPTGRPGEFVTIREIHPIEKWPEAKRRGVILAFIRVN